jgi:hypothetical protein
MVKGQRCLPRTHHPSENCNTESLRAPQRVSYGLLVASARLTLGRGSRTTLADTSPSVAILCIPAGGLGALPQLSEPVLEVLEDIRVGVAVRIA